MSINLVSFFSLLILFAATSCTAIKESPKYKLKDAIYHSSLISKSGHRVYIEVHEDTIAAYRAKGKKDDFTIEAERPIQTFPELTNDPKTKSYILYKPSLDIDFLTIPIKYRPEANGFPRTLNSVLCGAIYLGGRYDLFKINYKKTRLGTGEREINHYGFSAGIFTGVGSAFVAPWFTNNAISSEYDGVVFMKGVTLLIGINQFSAGLALGTDNLLDENDQFWIYEKKPWLGIVFGLNLN